MQPFADLTLQEQIAIHEAELGKLKRYVRDHERLIVSLLRTLSAVGEQMPGQATGIAAELQALLFEREQQATPADDWYYR